MMKDLTISATDRQSPYIEDRGNNHYNSPSPTPYHPNQRLEAARREIAFNNNLMHLADEFVSGVNKICELQQKLKQIKSPNYPSGTPKN